MNDRELMQQALDALVLAKSSQNMVLTSDPPQSAWRYYNVDMKLQDAIVAMRQAIEQLDNDYDTLSRKQLASIKRDTRVSFENAAVRAIESQLKE